MGKWGGDDMNEHRKVDTVRKGWMQTNRKRMGNAQRGASWARGFSLLELTLVIAIMGLLITVVVINVAGQGDRARRKTTEMRLGGIATALKQYHVENGSYPPTLQTLVTVKIMEAGKDKDAWDNAVFYDPRGRNEEQPFLLSSPGADKQSGTDDDINYWSITK